MNYLVTGATGFIGPFLVRRLIAQGHKCRCLVRTGSDTSRLKEFDVDLVTGDVTDPNVLNRIGDGVDYLIHMATLGHMNNFTASSSRFFEINVQGTINVMRMALASGIKKIVHCSSVAAMGICPDIPATEKSSCYPHHPYGRSKLQAEKEVIEMVSKQGLSATIVRFSMVYGPHDRRDILKLTRLAQKMLIPKIGTKTKLTPLVHVEDAVTGILAATDKGRNGEIYLLTNPRSIPFDKIIKTIQNELGVKNIAVYIPEWAALTAASVMEKVYTILGKVPPVTRKNIESTLADRVFSIEKAQRELNFNPVIDPEKGLAETVRWYRKKGWV